MSTGRDHSRRNARSAYADEIFAGTVGESIVDKQFLCSSLFCNLSISRRTSLTRGTSTIPDERPDYCFALGRETS